MAEDRRETDITKISFPLQLVILIVTSVMSVVASNYATQTSMKAEQAQTRSDLRDIATRFDLYRDTQKALLDKQDERYNALGGKMDAAAAATRAQMSAQDERINGLKASVESLSVAMKAANDALASSMRASNDAITRRQDYQAIQISNFQEALAKLTQRKE
jgi:hypothetical protein